MRMLMLALVLVLAGCEHPRYELDQELRLTIFKECMSALPAGPISTKYNDWDEVVYECRQTATYMAQRCIEYCPAFRER